LNEIHHLNTACIQFNVGTNISSNDLFRNNPAKNAADLGYAYLPQEVVTKEAYEAYASTLKEIDYQGIHITEDDHAESCANGACPIR